ncbi:trypsin-like serine peptidase [Streptomyces sp. CA-135486]|uniref:trypsin-like serine peptidase n=1 Tax=Streptomyces sp. CA-135486 TaxID=3240049 RepID=UPI003D91C2DA
MRNLRHALLPLATTALLALAGAGPALAGPADSGSGPAAVPAGAATTASPTARLSNGTPVDSAAAAALSRYWTPERMSKAVPLNVKDAPRAVRVKAGPTGPPGSTSPGRARSDTKRTLVNESAAVGKVYFTNPSNGLNYACSASALNSASKQMLITAGHCVHGGSGGTWMTNWVYVPRYRSGARPFGTYAAKQFRTFNSWISSSDLGRDVAMVTTWPLNGNKIVNVTGGHGLSWNYSRNQAMTVMGYPGNRDNGELQWACQGTTRGVSDGRIELQCDFGPGSSGGPWLREFNDANGLGNVNGAMSTISSGGWNRSSYFDDAVKGMFDAQGSVT